MVCFVVGLNKIVLVSCFIKGKWFIFMVVMWIIIICNLVKILCEWWMWWI